MAHLVNTILHLYHIPLVHGHHMILKVMRSVLHLEKNWNLMLMTWDSSIDIDFSLSDEFGNVVLTPLIEDSWSGSVICGQ